jgi:hypothetical protein
MSVNNLANFNSVQVEQNGSSADLNVLPVPTELSVNIFSYLGKKELAQCASTSKDWKVIAEDDGAWKEQAKKMNILEKLEGMTWKETCRQKDAQEKAAAEAILRKQQLIASEKRFNFAAKLTMGLLIFLLVAISAAILVVTVPIGIAIIGGIAAGLMGAYVYRAMAIFIESN